MTKVLLVDTGFSSVPIYNELCLMGYEVHVVGANPSDCLAKSSKHYWNINYADTEALANLIEQECFEFIVPGCTDRSYRSCVEVSNGRFPGIESVDVDISINNKAKFRELVCQLNLPTPQVQGLSNGQLRWPLIVKPVDAFSGKGITVIYTENHDQIERAIEDACKASEQGEYIIEDFVIGELYSHSAFLYNGKVVQDFIVQENGTTNPFVVDTSHVIAEPPPSTLQILRDSVEIIASALCLKDGLLHTQFILHENSVWLIEMTRRCPGDLYSQLIELSTGFAYVAHYIRPFLGQSIKEEIADINYRPIMRHTLTINKNQNLGYIRFNHPIQIEQWIPLSLVGDQIKPSPVSRIAILFASTNNKTELDMLYKKTINRTLYQIA